MATGLKLEELMKGTTRSGACGVNLTQRGKTHQVQTHNSFLILWEVAHGRSQLVE